MSLRESRFRRGDHAANCKLFQNIVLASSKRACTGVVDSSIRGLPLRFQP
jgi:hypothetical protein